MSIIKAIIISIVFIFLTILTQVGGIAFVIVKLIKMKFKGLSYASQICFFLVLYLLLTFLIVPNIAPLFGREKVKNSANIQPANYMTIFLNRNYVKPKINELLSKTEIKLRNKDILINYLDANFPFIDNFPLLPYLSHDDGEKIDISLIYEDTKGQISKKQKSRSGYGVFEQPKNGEEDQILNCKSLGYFQYDYPKYLTLGEINEELKFSEKGTKELLLALLSNKKLGKLFIEPHLKNRLNINDERIRYHGCKAVRHDDHIHIQLK